MACGVLKAVAEHWKTIKLHLNLSGKVDHMQKGIKRESAGTRHR